MSYRSILALSALRPKAKCKTNISIALCYGTKCSCLVHMLTHSTQALNRNYHYHLPQLYTKACHLIFSQAKYKGALQLSISSLYASPSSPLVLAHQISSNDGSS